MEIPDSVRAVLDGPGLVHLVTIEPDGRPQVSIVWVGLDGDEIVAGTCPSTARSATCVGTRGSLCRSERHRNQLGLDEYLVVHGRAQITEGGAAELLQRLAHVNLGPEAKFPPMDHPPPGYITHISVDRIGGVGPWAR